MRAVALAFSLIVLLPTAAAAPSAPTDMQASYDTSTQTLTLTWSQDASSSQPSGWNVYRDDQYVTMVTSRAYSEDLSNWGGGAHDYYVTAYDGSVESKASQTVHVSKVDGVWPLGCPIVTIIVTSLVPPQFYPGVNQECIPIVGH